MSQGRNPPAYQEYAATMLAQMPFRVASLEARGLLFTLRLELWVNERLPADPEILARMLGLRPPHDVARLLPEIMPFLKAVDGSLTCPELDAYRAALAERRERQSRGGKRSSELRNGKRKTAGGRAGKGSASTLQSGLQVPSQGAVKSLVQNRPVQNSKTQSSGNGDYCDDFIAAYEEGEQAESATAYRHASEGW